MKRAGINAARGQLEADDGPLDELEELRFHWGSAYDIGRGGGEFTASRRDRRGGVLGDRTPGGLLRKIRADYETYPVPRDLP